MPSRRLTRRSTRPSVRALEAASMRLLGCSEVHHTFTTRGVSYTEITAHKSLQDNDLDIKSELDHISDSAYVIH